MVYLVIAYLVMAYVVMVYAVMARVLMSRDMLHGTVQLAEIQKESVPQHELKGILNEVVRMHARLWSRMHAHMHAHDKQVAHIESLVLTANVKSAKAAARQEHAPQKHRIQDLASTATRPLSTAARPTATERALSDSAFPIVALTEGNDLECCADD